MSKGINKVILVGRLGSEPEANPEGTMARFSLATSESWTDKTTGQKVDKTEWHNIVTFRKLAEICCKYLHKGSQVYIEGSLRTRKWTDKSDVERITVEVVASDLQMLGSGNKSSSDDHQQASTRDVFFDEDIAF